MPYSMLNHNPSIKLKISWKTSRMLSRAQNLILEKNVPTLLIQPSTPNSHPDNSWQKDANNPQTCAQSAEKNSKNKFNASFVPKSTAKNAAVETE